ncbi:MAG: sugar ABC transporter substrate-binding protein [Eubacterium ramulus]|jgi:lactose/L-arabinose transport system substrate-binding protein|uniref:ABC transporter substrate-binding protein n=1 Tax=Eubacterium ramulus TaxID=39490 RepID=A0A2V1JR94_EUBRA|nr:sugar ABC transporter substrate-binding protein [Eubacterium ramulus]PWE86629.1 ABC transporter substrate-binding protein [Eubacterium ramulus]
MKKKVISLMLIGAMVASMAACGSNGGSDNGNAANGNDTSAAAESDGGASEGGNTLTVWTWDPAFNIPAIKEAGNIYKADHPDFELKVVETLSDDCETKLITAAESGDLSTLPDIVLMQDNSYQKFVSIYPEAFTDLTDSGIDFSQFAAGKLSYSTVDGKNYGVPFDNGAVIGAYRTDYLEQAGYTIDDLTDIDWNRFIEIAKDVKEKTGKYMLSGQADSPDMVMEMLQSAGASLFDKDGKPAMTDNAALKECISIYQKMVEEGVYYEVNNWDDYVSSITTGQVAGVINGNWISATIMGMKDTSGKWAITNMPKLIETPNATNYSNNGGSSWYITSNCKNKDLAIDFLKSTFAGSVKLYENILPTTGAIGTYAPAADSTAYQEPQEFWNNQPIFAKIVDFSLKTPTNNTSPYYYDGRNAIGTQIQNIMNGADVDQAIADAQAEVEFTMGE